MIGPLWLASMTMPPSSVWRQCVVTCAPAATGMTTFDTGVLYGLIPPLQMRSFESTFSIGFTKEGKRDAMSARRSDSG